MLMRTNTRSLPHLALALLLSLAPGCVHTHKPPAASAAGHGDGIAHRIARQPRRTSTAAAGPAEDMRRKVGIEFDIFTSLSVPRTGRSSKSPSADRAR